MVSMNANFAEVGFIQVSAPDLVPKLKSAVAQLARAIMLAESYASDSSIDSHGENSWGVIEEVSERLFRSQPEKYFGLLRAWTRSAEVINLCTSLPVVSAVSACGVGVPSAVTEPVLHVVSPNLVKSANKVYTPFHQDIYSTRGSIGQCVVWMPLHDILANHSTVEVVPASHMLGPLPVSESEFGAATIGKVTEAAGRKLQPKLGEFLIFSSLLVHRTTSPPALLPRRTVGLEGPLNQRWALSVRFNDLNDLVWRASGYPNPFERYRNSELADALPMPTVEDVQEYFS